MHKIKFCAHKNQKLINILKKSYYILKMVYHLFSHAVVCFYQIYLNVILRNHVYNVYILFIMS